MKSANEWIREFCLVSVDSQRLRILSERSLTQITPPPYRLNVTLPGVVSFNFGSRNDFDMERSVLP